MIRKLSKEDKNLVLEYVGKEPSINLFIIGDIEVFGFDKDFQEVWGKFDDYRNIKAVLLRYRNNFIAYYEDINEDVSGFNEIILSYPSQKMISGKSNLVDNFKDTFSSYKEKKTYFCEIKDASKLISSNQDIKIATKDDASEIFELLETIDEFSDTVNSEEIIRNKIVDKSGRIYYIENDKGEIVSVAQTTAENTKSAMIVGVATKAEYRENGYMSECLSKLCKDLLEEGKTLCLFYDNPKAGRVYHKIGFKDIGMWTMLIESRE